MSVAIPLTQKFVPMNNRELANILWPNILFSVIYTAVCTQVLFQPPLALTAEQVLISLALLLNGALVVSYLSPTRETYLFRGYEILFVAFWVIWLANRILLIQVPNWPDLFTVGDDGAAFDVLLTIVVATISSVQAIPVHPHLNLAINPIDLNNYIPLTKNVIPDDDFVKENRMQSHIFLFGAFVAQASFSVLFIMLPSLFGKEMMSIIPGPFTFVLMLVTISIPMGQCARLFRERKLFHTAGITSGIALVFLFLIGINCVASAVLLIMHCAFVIKSATKFEHEM